jgi:hypothetical protein
MGANGTGAVRTAISDCDIHPTAKFLWSIVFAFSVKADHETTAVLRS